ncbi:hypothetical protein BpHYR1_051162 [Brachionus plicatilis]|uniref:Uncharacterized protein n=1 Tax=Brachionus plicatilis TaxID=10195 RepID=A0A3M7PSK3_BRAPC|nr:hypothetical protein BpHYR1_051162 [Brachionus plicatilis]
MHQSFFNQKSCSLIKSYFKFIKRTKHFFLSKTLKIIKIYLCSKEMRIWKFYSSVKIGDFSEICSFSKCIALGNQIRNEIEVVKTQLI